MTSLCLIVDCLETSHRVLSGLISRYFSALSHKRCLQRRFVFLSGFLQLFFVATRPLSTRSLWLFFFTIPYWKNLLIRTVFMKFLVRDTGSMNEAFLGLGLLDSPLRLVNTNIAVQLGLFYSYLPFMVFADLRIS